MPSATYLCLLLPGEVLPFIQPLFLNKLNMKTPGDDWGATRQAFHLLISEWLDDYSFLLAFSIHRQPVDNTRHKL
jgi:hypothetical protein